MKPTWVLSAPCGTHVGPINLAIGVVAWHECEAAIDVSVIQYIPRNMHTVFALLCFVVVIHWLIFPYPSGLLHWHCGNLTIAPVPAKQPWWIWINTSCEFIMNDCITTTKQSTTKPCAYSLGYTVLGMWLGAGFWWFRTLHRRSSGFNMGPTWVLSDPCGTHVGPINLAIGVVAWHECEAAIDVSVILGMWLGAGFWWFRTLHRRSNWYCKLLIQVAPYVYSFQITVRCRYNAVNFLTNIHKNTP